MMTTLELTPRTLEDLGFTELLSSIAARCQSDPGREHVLGRGFLNEPSEAEVAFALIEEARQLLRRDLAMPLGGAEDIRALVRRARMGAVLEPAELQQCSTVARQSGNVKRFVTGLADDVPLLSGSAQRLVDLRPLAARIDACLEPSGGLKDEASVALAEYRGRARALHQRIRSTIEAKLDDPQFVHWLQDGYFSLRNERYVVPVKSNFRAQVPGIVHNASQSGQTIFVELEELIPMGNELTIAQALALEEEQRVLGELSTEVAEYGDSLLRNGEILAELDAVQGEARWAHEFDCTTPSLGAGDGRLVLRGARHPLLLLQGKRVVPNTIELSPDQRALVISGPNAGGKTVAMTTVGLSLLLARRGLPIPASAGSTVPWIAGLACRVGDAQDLHQDLSTFSAHLEALGELLRRCANGWFALVDEIASGTDPQEGSALASAVLEHLVEHGARVCVTTHLDAVKALALTDARFVNARVGMDPHTLRPTFELELGIAGVSKAIDVAAQVGIPAPVIARARELLAGGGALGVALARLDEAEQAARRVQAEHEALRLELEEQRESLARERESLRRQRAEVERDVRQEMIRELEEVEALAKEQVAKLQSAATMQAAQKLQSDARQRRQEHQRAVQVLSAKANGSERQVGKPLQVGASVTVPSLGQIGEVIALHGDEAEVRVGLLRTRVKIAELVPASRRTRRAHVAHQQGATKSSKRAPQAPRERLDDPITTQETCDLRGMRADEAERAIHAFLDQHYLAGPTHVMFIHGHGTGALRNVVRETLQMSDVVESFRLGESGEGGEGVTIAALRND